jgi:purine-binding chemotaxis protein CheW
MDVEQFVAFRLGNEEYAVSISRVREIIRFKGATKMPNAPEYVEGIINLRGKIIPVVSLAARLGLNMENVTGKWVIILETTGQEFAILVDVVTEVIKLDDTSIEAAPTMLAQNSYIRGLGKIDERLIILLEVSNMIDAKEMEELQKIV